MAQQTKTTLKTYFETGDQPNQAQFEDFIDSYPNISDLGLPIISKHYGYTPVTTVGTGMFTVSDVFIIPANELTVNGQGFLFEAWGKTSSGTVGKDFAVRTQSLDMTVRFGSLPSGVKVWRLNGQLIRLSALTAMLSISVQISKAVTVINDGQIAMSVDNAVAYDWAVADSLEVRAQAPTSGDTTFYGWTIRKFLV